MLRIATLNQYQPGMSSDDLSDVGQPVNGGSKGYKVNVWEALRGWGQRLYRKADILFVTEIRNGSHVRFLAQPDVSGLQYYAMMKEEFFTNIAILSRYPLHDVLPIYSGRNEMLKATVTIDGLSHLLIAAHWDKVTSQERLEAAQRILESIQYADSPTFANMPAFVGGDLNVQSGYGPEGLTGSTLPEYVLLVTKLWDVYTMFLPPPPYCSDQRLDYILFKGDYEPMEFHACLDAAPSDHPYVIASFKRKGDTSSQVKTHASVTAVSPAKDEILVTSISEEAIENGRIFFAHRALDTGWDG